MLRAAIAGMVLATASVSMSGAALAQWGWSQRYDDRYPFRRPHYQPAPGPGVFWGDESRPRRPPSAANPSVTIPARRPSGSAWSGGPRPTVRPIAPQRIAFPSGYPVGGIVIDHKGRQLLLIESPRAALRYPISVGREGFGWSGTHRISRVVDWPDWYPPADMRERDPRLPAHMTGGLRNPLGVKALYLGNTLYRIHGTNDPASIGRASSSGCFRMLNGQVLDLASRVGIGTPVTVVRRLPPSLAQVVSEQVAGTAPPGFDEGPVAARRPSYPAPDDLFDDPSDEDTAVEDVPAGEGAGARGWERPS